MRRYNGKTGAFIDDFVPAGSGGLGAPFHINFTAQSPIQTIRQAIGLVQELPLSSGLKTSLTSKLNAVATDVAQGHIAGACVTLRAEVNQVNAFIQTHQLSAANAAPLLSEVQAIQHSLGCL